MHGLCSLDAREMSQFRLGQTAKTNERNALHFAMLAPRGGGGGDPPYKSDGGGVIVVPFRG